MKPKVTFVLYTIRDRYIIETLKSIKGQTLKDWELFIYNNDSERKITWNDKRVTIINTDNLPVVNCILDCREKANSNIILECSDDDPNFAERAEICYNYIERGSDVFFASYLFVGPTGIPFKYYQSKKFNHDYHRFVRIGNSMAFGAYRNDICPLQRNNFKYMIDYIFITDCIKKGLRLSYTSTPLGYRYVHNSQVSSENTDKRAEEIDKIRELYNDSLILTKRATKKYKIPAWLIPTKV